jgi:hypothetical protein
MKFFLRWCAFALLSGLCACASWGRTPTSEPRHAGRKNARSVSSEGPHTTPSDVEGTANYITIPGPLRSFERMAAISQKAAPDEVLPLLGHFVETYGYDRSKAKSPKPTEALILFKRYFAQAKTLASLAGPGATLHFSSCQDSTPLLKILGYRLADTCAANPSIRVEDREKAFTTVDSGFPLADVEQALLHGKPFSMPYPSASVPLIYTKRDWTGKEASKDADVIDSFADDPTLSRLYWGLSRVDEETRDELWRSLGIAKMMPMASVIDFYGSTLALRAGRVAVPGGTGADAAWKRLVGAEPGHPAEFLVHLLQKDNGLLAEYYDSVARAPRPELTYLTRGDHLQRFYAAFRGQNASFDAVRSVFRPGAGLLLLVTRLPVDNSGELLVPGNLNVWKQTFRRKSASKTERELDEKAGRWTTPEQFLQGLFALSRSYPTDGPLDMYMSLSEIDRRRPADRRMGAQTARLLIAHFAKLHDQYEIFSEFGDLDDASIADFVKMTEKIDQVRDPLLRGDVMGIFEANIGLWQIFARQGQIPGAELNESWRQVIHPFEEASNAAQLFDAARASLAQLMKTVTGAPEITQEKIIDLLAGPQQSSPNGRQVHQRLADEIQQILTDQRLVSLDTLLELDRDFTKMKGSSSQIDLPRAMQMAEELEEARAPRAMFTEAERAEWVPGHEPNRHILMEMRTDLKKSFRQPIQPAGSAGRGALTPFLRDTLVGLNYAYYEPPSGQILHSSPQLVRAHDFLASESVPENRAWLAPQLFGVGLTAANGTHLSGSLAGLPYALAEMEQDFIVPRNVQALIWQQTTADLLTSSVVPRWWSISPLALRAAALYQKAAEELIAGAAKDESLRMTVTDILSNQLPPETMDQVNRELGENHVDEALDRIAPAQAFYLTAEFERQFPGRMAARGPAGTELEVLIKRDPDEVSPERISQDFGVPHPVLAECYAQEMLNLKPFPSVMNYASEFLAESWESTNLYWARLANDMGYAPVMLNELAPMLTRRMVETIFGSDFDDWPALMRAMRETGDEFRRGQVNGVPKVDAADAHQVGPAN